MAPRALFEWGSSTYGGASNYGGAGGLNVGQGSYNEDEQANYIEGYCELLNKVRIDGCFLHTFTETEPKAMGILNFKKRKKGFYMYKSYERVGS